MNDELWRRLQDFNFDNPDADFSFSDRLARDNGWTAEFANRVIEEYRRFLFLYVECGHPVTPSDEVDQAWHLHLCYTESYWHELCRDTIGKPIHHGPTKGGESERAKFHDWYSETLSSYERIFGEKPPTDCWPPAEKRFASLSFERVDRATHLVIPKRMVALLFAMFVPLIFATGCEWFDEETKFTLGMFAIFFVPVLLIAVVIWKFGNGGSGGGTGCGGCGGGTGCGGCGGCG